MNVHDELEKILNLAIGREEGANKFYRSLAKKVTNVSVKETFNELAIEELNHKALLLALKADPNLESRLLPVPVDYKIAETEDSPDLTENMTPKEAIALAMKKELQAVNLYETLAGAAKTDEVRRMFENLVNMELGHKNKLEVMFVDIGYPEVF